VRVARGREAGGMNSKILLTSALALALVAAPAEAAKKKKPRSAATYMTTVKASMTESWNFRDYYSSTRPSGGVDVREQKGSGTASANLRTRKPFALMAIRGPQGRPVTLNLGSDGIPMTGSWVRGGEMTTTYTGPWETGNPDVTEETTDCGKLDVNTFGSIGWSYESPGNLQLIVDSEPQRDSCPDGPPNGLEWENGESPSLIDVLASVGKQKFLYTKQFTVRGTRTWKGTVTPVNRTSDAGSKIVGGEKTVTWQWEATFRMKTAKRKKR
jgi:hypothetical protein